MMSSPEVEHVELPEAHKRVAIILSLRIQPTHVLEPTPHKSPGVQHNVVWSVCRAFFSTGFTAEPLVIWKYNDASSQHGLIFCSY
jgi:hypothetical protein